MLNLRLRAKNTFLDVNFSSVFLFHPPLFSLLSAHFTLLNSISIPVVSLISTFYIKMSARLIVNNYSPKWRWLAVDIYRTRALSMKFSIYIYISFIVFFYYFFSRSYVTEYFFCHCEIVIFLNRSICMCIFPKILIKHIARFLLIIANASVPSFIGTRLTIA